MSGLPQVTVIGTLTAAPEMRFTSAGVATASFTIAANARKKDEQGNWVDGDATFLRCSIWRDAAENVVESLDKGSRVLAVGRLKQRSFETREGDKRTVMELEVDEIGPSLRWATAKPNKAGRGGPVDMSSGGSDPWMSPQTADADLAPF